MELYIDWSLHRFVTPCIQAKVWNGSWKQEVYGLADIYLELPSYLLILHDELKANGPFCFCHVHIQHTPIVFLSHYLDVMELASSVQLKESNLRESKMIV